MIEITPKIKMNNNLSAKLLIHFLLTFLGFIGAFAIIFFGILGGGGHSHGNRESRKEVLTYLVTHDSIFILICCVGAIVLNIIYFNRNYKTLIIRHVKLDINQNLLALSNQKYYSNEIKYVEYELDKIRIETTMSNFFLSESKYSIYSFYCGNKNIGNIDTSDIAWEKESDLINLLISEFNKRQPTNHL